MFHWVALFLTYLEGFSRCTKVHYGLWWTSWTTWIKSWRSEASWVFYCGGSYFQCVFSYVLNGYMIALFITLMQQSRRSYSSPFVVFQIKSLRAAYRKIFMPSEGNLVGIEDRLTELVLHQYKTRIFSYYLL